MSIIAYLSFLFLGCGYKSAPFYQVPPKNYATEIFQFQDDEALPSVPLIDDGTLDGGELQLRGANGTRM